MRSNRIRCRRDMRSSLVPAPLSQPEGPTAPPPPPPHERRSRSPLERVAYPRRHILWQTEEERGEPLVRRCRDLESVLECDRDSCLCHVCCPKSSTMLDRKSVV